MSQLTRNRRAFLRALGSGALSLPFYGLLENSAVRAQAGELPMRYVSVYHKHAAASPLYLRRDGETETDFDISYADCVLRCFDDPDTYGKSFKDKLIAIDGVDLASALITGQVGHAATGGTFTGATPNSPENSSIDQFLAVEHGLGAETRVSSVALGVGYNNVDESISFGAGGGLLQTIIDPTETYNTFFAGIVVGDDPEALASAERERRLGGSLLDYLRADVEWAGARLAGPEREKLDIHLQTLRELEKRLSDFEFHCSNVPDLPPRFETVSTWEGAGPNMHEITLLQLGFLAQAMACDLTRFASVHLHDLSRGAGEAAGIAGMPDDNHEAIAHKYLPPVYDGTGLLSPGDPETWEQVAVINRYNYGSVAAFMKQLDDAALLDDALIYMIGDMGNPNTHSSRDTPMLVLGGTGGKFLMGRHVKVKDNCLDNAQSCSGQEQFVPQNQILVSIANAFGVEVESYGTSSVPSITEGAMASLTQLGVSL